MSAVENRQYYYRNANVRDRIREFIGDRAGYGCEFLAVGDETAAKPIDRSSQFLPSESQAAITAEERAELCLIEKRRRYEESAAHSFRTHQGDGVDRFRHRSRDRGASGVLSRGLTDSHRCAGRSDYQCS
jgi:hypothetical protein